MPLTNFTEVYFEVDNPTLKSFYQGGKGMKKVAIFVVAILALGLMTIPAGAQGKFDGYMIAEYFSVLNHHDEDIQDRHGLWLRRIYLTYNNNLTDTIKMRLRLEMASPGDFSSATLDPFVKDAYLSSKLAGQELRVGIFGPPTFEAIESVWGYRPLEKTPLDLQKWRSSRDFGIALKGNIDSGKMLPYFLMFGNGSSNKAEDNKGKVLYASLGFNPSKAFFLEAYVDSEHTKDGKSSGVYQGFAAVKGDWGRIGFQYTHRNYKQKLDDADDVKEEWDLISAFAVFSASEKLDIIARFDKLMEPNSSGHKIAYIPFADNAPSTLIIGALAVTVAKGVQVIPNVKYVFYGDPEEGDKPDDDFYANMTLYFKF